MIAMLILLAAGAAAQGAPPRLRLELPVRCAVGANCLVQKLVDVQRGPGRQDYRCGLLTTEEHDGVDIRLRSFAQMRAGVAVVAAAEGEVLRIRDGELDAVSDGPMPAGGREAGNGVVIGHGGGWETQYSHLRSGSIAVKPGQTVKAGAVLGMIGLSGLTEYPHVHFQVRRGGATIDPFTGSPPPSRCGVAGAPLWSAAAAAVLSYRPTEIIAVGFASSPPKAEAARKGALDQSSLPRTSGALVLWADAMGAAPGDVQRFTIWDPDGGVMHSHVAPVERGGLSWFGFSGKRAPPGGWPAGTYRGRYEILRGGQLKSALEGRVMIR
jgi:Peptidase family M23